MPSLRERADRRERAIERFCERQRVTRRWISFADLVDWCATVTTTAGIVRYEKARDLVLRSLAVSIPNGEFEGDQRRGNDGSQILYLAPYVPGDDAPPRCRLIREQFNFVYEAALPLPPTMLSQLWVPRDLARRWLESHNYSCPPFLSEFLGSTLPARDGLRKFQGSDSPPSRHAADEPPAGGSTTQPGEIAITLEGNIGFENRTVPPFVVGSAHTVFEWCMVYTDQHPAGLHPNHNSASFRDMRNRLTLLGATGGEQKDAYGEPMGARNDPEWQTMNEVYRELAWDIERDRIRPLRLTFCGDAPSEFDPTRCLIDIEPVLALARRRQDFGQTMAELLAAHDGKPEIGPESVVDDALTHSGYPGRPSKGKHLIDDEFDRRIAAGEALPSLADEAKALLDWFKRQHPKVARPTTKTIQENIRVRHRQWRTILPQPDTT
jgi:hypothetical protein